MYSYRVAKDEQEQEKTTSTRIMAGFIQNILWNSVSGFVEAGTRTAGGYAGDALIKAGDMIENSGRSIGDGTSTTSVYPSNLSQAPFEIVYFSSVPCLLNEVSTSYVKRSRLMIGCGRNRYRAKSIVVWEFHLGSNVSAVSQGFAIYGEETSY